MNQGMLMESMNLAAVWKLPVLFVCKDDGWGITTRKEISTGGNLDDRARGLGVPAFGVDGVDVSQVWETARSAIDRIRSGEGPAFLHARCVHLEGHFLGLQTIRIVRDPLKEMPKVAAGLTKSILKLDGAAVSERLTGLKNVMSSVISTLRDPRRDRANDPLLHTRVVLQPDESRLKELEGQMEKEINDVLETALGEVPS